MIYLFLPVLFKNNMIFKADIDKAVAAARAAFAPGSAWRIMDPGARSLVLLKWADLIEKNAKEIAVRLSYICLFKFSSIYSKHVNLADRNSRQRQVIRRVTGRCQFWSVSSTLLRGLGGQDNGQRVALGAHEVPLHALRAARRRRLNNSGIIQYTSGCN